MHLDDLAISTGTFPGWSSPPPSINIGSAPDYTYSNTSMAAALHMSTLELKGENADIRINGISLTDVLKNIEHRLHILRPDTELEAKWGQLRELGDQYRRLEAELKEKSLMWNKLKAIPPTID
jgi:hypothetical protein